MLAAAESPVVADATRVCCDCERTLPITSFRKQWSGRANERSKYCRRCHAERERRRLADVKATDDRRAVHRYWGQVSSSHKQRVSIRNVTMALLKRFGGPAGLAAAWVSAYENASTTRKLRANDSLILLLQVLEKLTDQATAPEQMNDRQLDEALQRERVRAMSELLRDEPDVAVAVAQQFGFELTTITQPTEARHAP